jgi:hypothetical protein
VPNRLNKKHFIIYNNGGVISCTTPKDWARAHQECFPNKDFSNSDNTPRVDEIENYLTQHRNFKRVANDQIVVCYDYKAI